MPTRLTLICHAPTPANRAARFPRDEPLDPAGEAAMAMAAARPALAEAMARAGRRLTSPTARARQSAACFGHGVAEAEELRDQDFGRWSGRSMAEVAAAEPDAVASWMSDPNAAPHGGESLADLLSRVARWMEDQAALGGRVAAVTHPAVVRAACVAALAAGPASFWRIEAPPLALAAFSHDGRRWTLTGLGGGE